MSEKTPEQIIKEQAERIRQLQASIDLLRKQFTFYVQYGQRVQDRELPSLPLC